MEAPAQEDAYSESERSHWSFQAVQRPALPPLASDEERRWVRNTIDGFILDRRRQAKIPAAPEADRGALIRRLYFDLTGEPPSPADIARFTSDTSPDAYEQLVDRLLASPQYGEHWAQHWLDVVRYAESEGFEYDRHRAGAWRYRDYVIAALNGDKPYDRFVIEQIAGDELAAEERMKEEGKNKKKGRK